MISSERSGVAVRQPLVPEDDGACRLLVGRELPSLRLAASDGTTVDLARERGWTVCFIFSQLATARDPLPSGWDSIPGARGCRAQVLGFRDWAPMFDRLGVRLFGLSAQRQAAHEAAAREFSLPFALLSDTGQQLGAALGLPEFRVSGRTFYRRAGLVLFQGRIAQVFYPVFPPHLCASQVLAWVASAARSTSSNRLRMSAR